MLHDSSDACTNKGHVSTFHLPWLGVCWHKERSSSPFNKKKSSSSPRSINGKAGRPIKDIGAYNNSLMMAREMSKLLLELRSISHVSNGELFVVILSDPNA
jgi:hypothetical protein